MKSFHNGLYSSFRFKILFIYLFTFTERGAGREKEKERNTDVRKTHPSDQGPGGNPGCTLTGNHTDNLSVCGVTPNPPSHTSHGFSFHFKTYCNTFWFN